MRVGRGCAGADSDMVLSVLGRLLRSSARRERECERAGELREIVDRPESFGRSFLSIVQSSSTPVCICHPAHVFPLLLVKDPKPQRLEPLASVPTDLDCTGSEGRLGEKVIALKRGKLVKKRGWSRKARRAKSVSQALPTSSSSVGSSKSSWRRSRGPRPSAK